MDLNDTIAAIASPPGPAVRGIIRISGQDAPHFAAQVFRGDGLHEGTSQARRFPGSVSIPAFDVAIPAALLLWPTSRSYTGQPMAEIHSIGAPPLLNAILAQLFQLGVRHANRGEFTLRAFLAGRMDLVQAEAVLGIIDAADHKELESALTQLGGGITASFRTVRSDIIALLGDLEAGLDFVEEDIEFISNQQICDRLSGCADTLTALAQQSAERLPSGSHRRVVLAGLPNAGKSTLFNRLLDRKKAIVSPVPGTTRDYLSGLMKIDGMELEVVDTAGWEDAADLVMNHAQNLRKEQMHLSDLVVWCTSADLNEQERLRDSGLKQKLEDTGCPVLNVTTRVDLGKHGSLPPISVSAITGDGISDLLQAIRSVLAHDQSSRAELVATTSVRCGESLEQAICAIESARQAAQQQLGDEIVAMELRTALHKIAVILGEVYTDDILDHVFSHFCIGK